MDKRTLVLIVGVASVLISGRVAFPGRNTFAARPTIVQGRGTAPVLAVVSIRRARLDRPLEFEWTMSNRGPASVYIYSSLLDHPGSAFIEADPATRELRVRFLSLQKYSWRPYYFPKTEFREIKPAGHLDGRFVSQGAIGRIIRDFAVPTHADPRAAVGGSWALRISIAYGFETDSVRAAIRKQYDEDRGHLINPVVDWQKVAESEPVSLTITR